MNPYEPPTEESAPVNSDGVAELVTWFLVLAILPLGILVIALYGLGI